MDSRDAKRLTDAVVDLRRSLDKLGETAKRAAGSKSATAVEPLNETTLDHIPVNLDWVVPAIPGLATFVRRANGTLRIEITVQNDGLVMDLLEQMDVNALQLSVVEP